MKWSSYYDIYTDEILDAVKHYAFENCIYDPIISSAFVNEKDWFGKIFNVSDIDSLLNNVIKEAMNKQNIISKVKEKGYDKFIITPDVFSESDVQTDYPYNNEYDMDRRQVLYMNKKLFEVIDRRDWKSIKFNFNNKTYIFFNSEKQGTMIDGSKSDLEIIDFKEYSFIDEDPNVADFWDKTNKLLLKFTENRKLFVNDEVADEDNVLVGVTHPYMLYDYHKDFNGEEIKEDPRLKLYGLKSFNKDMTITEKPIVIDDRDKLMIHNRNIIYASTGIVIYKDKSFIIENFKNPVNKTIIERYDKHTVYVHKDDNIDKIILFLHPIGISNPMYRIDEMYDHIKVHSNKAFMLLKKLVKPTNILVETLIKNSHITIKELIEFGYKYDKDVLKIIQRSIPTYISLNKTYVSVKTELFGTRFYRPKIVIQVPNRINGFPQLIINNRFVSHDYKIIKNRGVDWLVLDANRVFNLPIVDININNLNHIKNNVINTIEVAFITKSYYDEEFTDIRPKRVLASNKIHKRIFVMDSYKGFEDSALFINGRLTYSKFINDKDYTLNYGVHRVPILKNMMNETIDEYYLPNNTKTSADVLGFTRENKSINILSNYYSGQQFYLDITKERNITRSLMMLNLGHNSKMDYQIFNNIENRNEHGYVTKNKLPKFKNKIAKNKTIFFDYDGLVIKPNILTEDYVDIAVGYTQYKYMSINPNINTVTGSGFINRNNDAFCLHYINLNQINEETGLDLNIDESRISKINSGSFNENAMKIEDVNRLFSYYSKKSEIRPIETYTNDYVNLRNMKIYFSYWYAHLGETKLNTTTEYRSMINSNPGLFQSNTNPVEDKLRAYFPLNEEWSDVNLYDVDLSSYMFHNIDLSSITDTTGYIIDDLSVDSSNKYNIELEERFKYSNSLSKNTIGLSTVFSTLKIPQK